MTHLNRFDTAVDGAFDHLRQRSSLNRLFYSLSALADHSLLWEIIATALAISPQHRRRAVRASIALALESLFINLVVKSIFARERPIDATFEHPHHLRYPLTSSFPSGHTTAAFAAASLLADGKASRCALFPLATLVAISRIHVRIHHASDVAGGMVIGLGFAQLVKWLVPIPRRHTPMTR